MTDHPPFTALVADLPATVPFVGPEALERQWGRPVQARLGANESRFGPSPRVIDALCSAAPDVWRYPDPENFDLRRALANRLGVDMGNIAVGEGIDGLMALAVRLFIAAGDRVVTSLGAYPTLNYHVAGFGGSIVAVPYSGVREDLEGLVAAAHRSGARMVYLANPDNPMGSCWPATEVAAFAAALPSDCLLLLDEAYGELAPPDALPPLDPDQQNVLRLRTFSKAFGLAGLRCGYAIGHPSVVGAFDRIRNHFGVNRQAQVAALAALDDAEHLDWVVRSIRAACDRISSIASAAGLEALPTATNFVAIDCQRDAAFAQRILAEMARDGIFIRKPMAPGLDRYIRISAAPDDELDILAAALPLAVQRAQDAP
ncbi:pyridoxal phosphate-dependent aminotransferase [Devosia sp. PTR5]|uniref:histidinol-phosphate transaminase n=1 Tax=Devosia oryzisoli TaxID=2774138 RepID=A0A927FQN0_9HYPH|nr:pyridoxal phosphate-dependent aminotransferase [Devosia oryzisoli]MBD8064241.1 pyridoxal phosphate-dependent aminotransferase [Devosia oryzisoli]